MNFDVRVTSSAQRDLARLRKFLALESRSAADRAMDVLDDAIQSLKAMPHRGRPALEVYRELFVPFGRNGYVIRYRAERTVVIIAQILHSREKR